MEDCYICFKPNTDNITTLCNHNVHKPGFMEWKIINNTCPICRKINPIHEYTLFELQNNKVLSTSSNKVLSNEFYNYLYNLIQFYIYLFLVFIISYNFFRLLNQII